MMENHKMKKFEENEENSGKWWKMNKNKENEETWKKGKKAKSEKNENEKIKKKEKMKKMKKEKTVKKKKLNNEETQEDNWKEMMKHEGKLRIWRKLWKCVWMTRSTELWIDGNTGHDFFLEPSLMTHHDTLSRSPSVTGVHVQAVEHLCEQENTGWKQATRELIHETNFSNCVSQLMFWRPWNLSKMKKNQEKWRNMKKNEWNKKMKNDENDEKGSSWEKNAQKNEEHENEEK